MTANSLGNFILGTQTLTSGGVITLSGTPISLPLTGNIAIIGSSTQTVHAAASTAPGPSGPAVLTFAGSSITANSLGNFIFGSQTLTPGGMLTVSGTPISLSPTDSIAVVGGTTQTLHNAAPTAVLSFGGTSITANSLGAFIIGTQTLTPGGQITVSGTTLSLPSSPHSSFPLSVKGAFTLNGNTYTENSLSEFIIGSQTLSPGGVVTVSGTPVSFATGAGTPDVIVGGTTQLLATFITSGIGGGSKATGQVYVAEAPRVGWGTMWALGGCVLQMVVFFWVR